jgi:hypothetical protein
MEQSDSTTAVPGPSAFQFGTVWQLLFWSGLFAWPWTAEPSACLFTAIDFSDGMDRIRAPVPFSHARIEVLRELCTMLMLWTTAWFGGAFA